MHVCMCQEKVAPDLKLLPQHAARCLSGFLPPLETLLVSDKKYKIHMAEEKPKGSDLAGSEEEIPLILSLFPLCL